MWKVPGGTLENLQSELKDKGDRLQELKNLQKNLILNFNVKNDELQDATRELIDVSIRLCDTLIWLTPFCVALPDNNTFITKLEDNKRIFKKFVAIMDEIKFESIIEYRY